MNLTNPQNLAPVLSALRETLVNDMQNLSKVMSSANDMLSKSVVESQEALNQELAKIPTGAIKNIYRISGEGLVTVTIPEVDINKTIINVLTGIAYGRYASSSKSWGFGTPIGAKLISSSEVQINARWVKQNASIYSNFNMDIEVIEYA